MNVGVDGLLRVADEGHIVTVRKTVRDIASQLGFGLTDVTRIVTAASELARNILHYAGSGTMLWCAVEENGNVGIELTFEDHGPGIPDVEEAMREGYSTGGGLGLGLPGTRRLMDDMVIQSQVGQGTKVRIRKWRRR